MRGTGRPLLATVGPPKELLARLRWCFLAFGLFFVVTYLPQLVLQSDRPWPVRLASAAVLLSLGVWWLTCYRWGRFPVPGLDTAARLGGDEFVIVLPGCVSIHEAGAVAQRLLDAVRLPVSIDRQVVTVGASIGMAIGRPGVTPAALLREADEAMYEAKRLGKNRVCAAPEVSAGL